MANGSDVRILADRKKALEEQFFAREERQLLERVRAEAAQKERRQALAHASGIDDAAVIDRLVALDLDGGTIAALGLVPLVEVAWADGTLHERERDAVVQASEVPVGVQVIGRRGEDGRLLRTARWLARTLQGEAGNAMAGDAMAGGAIAGGARA